MTAPIPDEMVEAAARAAHEHDRQPDEPAFDDLQPWDKDSYREYARTALAAALSVCGIRQVWRDYDTVSGGSVGFATREQAEEFNEKYSQPRVAWDPPPHKCVVQTALVLTWPDGSVLTTPWREVQP